VTTDRKRCLYRPHRRAAFLATCVLAAVVGIAAAAIWRDPGETRRSPERPAPSTTRPPPTTRPRSTVPVAEPKVGVGGFTTQFQCCQPRVTNIARAAAVLNGWTIPAGGRFSLNAALGERTRAAGYVPAPSIAGGELVDSVGGGISQIATTLYNAAFFAGLRLVAHTPHSFYISRYPMGREATISWGGPELIFANDWASPLVMRLAVRRDAIDIRFFSQRLGRRVTSSAGQPHSYVQPTTIVRPTLALAVGQRRVVQAAGSAGFTIEYGRRVFRYGRLRRDESWRVTYEPQNEIVEIGHRDS
jgi:vancomycin resistance protein YoaR